MRAKVNDWANEIKQLSIYAASQPHAAYSAFTHGLSSKRNYLMQTTNADQSLLLPLEDAIRFHFVPAITGKEAISDIARDLHALPVRLGSLSIGNPTLLPASQYSASISITAPLTSQILQQSNSLSPGTKTSQAEAKAKVRRDNRMSQSEVVDTIQSQLPLHSQWCLELSLKKGASTWLAALPIQDHGFTLHKSAFQDAICLRYGWGLKQMASHCLCG